MKFSVTAAVATILSVALVNVASADQVEETPEQICRGLAKACGKTKGTECLDFLNDENCSCDDKEGREKKLCKKTAKKVFTVRTYT